MQVFAYSHFNKECYMQVFAYSHFNKECHMQVFSYSHFNKEGEVGDTTAEALSARDVRWAKIKSEKPPVGVPAEPGPDLGIEYR